MKRNKINEALDAFHALSQEDKRVFFSLITMKQQRGALENKCIIYLKKRRDTDQIDLSEVGVIVREDRKMKIIGFENEIMGIYTTSLCNIKSQIMKTEMANDYYFHKTFMVSLWVFQDIPSSHLSTAKTGEVLLRFGLYVCDSTARNIREFILKRREFICSCQGLISF